MGFSRDFLEFLDFRLRKESDVQIAYNGVYCYRNVRL